MLRRCKRASSRRFATSRTDANSHALRQLFFGLPGSQLVVESSISCVGAGCCLLICSFSRFCTLCLGVGGGLQPYSCVTILQIERGRLIVAIAMQCFTILHKSIGRGMLILSKQNFTILNASRGRRGLLPENTMFHNTAHTVSAQEAASS